MAITLTRPADANVRAALSALEAVRPAEAQALAVQFNAGALSGDQFVKALSSRVAHLTTGNAAGALSSNAARFGASAPASRNPAEMALLGIIGDVTSSRGGDNRGAFVTRLEPIVSSLA